MIVVTCHASVYTLVLMSLDRFLAVVHPISSISIRTQWNALLWVPRPLKEPKLISKTFFLFHFHSAIIVTWVIVTISAIPVGVSHGTVDYTNHKSEINTACLFLSDEGTVPPTIQSLAQPSLQILSFFSSLAPTGYNWAAFQVKTAEKKLIIRINTDIEITQSPRATSPLHFSLFQISFFLSSYIVPLTLISILYVGMLIRLWHSVPGSKVSAESRRGKKRVTRMVVFVVLGELFLLGFLLLADMSNDKTKFYCCVIFNLKKNWNKLSKTLQDSCRSNGL